MTRLVGELVCSFFVDGVVFSERGSLKERACPLSDKINAMITDATAVQGCFITSPPTSPQRIVISGTVEPHIHRQHTEWSEKACGRPTQALSEAALPCRPPDAETHRRRSHTPCRSSGCSRWSFHRERGLSRRWTLERAQGAGNANARMAPPGRVGGSPARRPVATATNWRPFTTYDIGGAPTPAPVSTLHTTTPFAAS